MSETEYETEKLMECRLEDMAGAGVHKDAEEFRIVLPTGVQVDVRLRVLVPEGAAVPFRGGVLGRVMGAVRYRRPNLEEVLLTISALWRLIG